MAEKDNAKKEEGIFKNPFDKDKEPQRHQDWSDGFMAALKIQFKPDGGDVIAGIAVRMMLRGMVTLSPADT